MNEDVNSAMSQIAMVVSILESVYRAVYKLMKTRESI